MAGSGAHDDAVRLRAQHVRKYDGVRGRSGQEENAGVRDDSDETAQDEFGNAERFSATDSRVEPASGGSMERRVVPIGVDEDVYVRE